MSNDDYEDKDETITFDEFRAWMNGLIKGKGGAIPDLDDWKTIKKMMDKVVVPEQLTSPLFPWDQLPQHPITPDPYQWPFLPDLQPTWTPGVPWVSPDSTGNPPMKEWTITCGDLYPSQSTSVNVEK